MAEERDRVGAIGAETVDNLRVPQGAACTLTGTRVNVRLQIRRGGSWRSVAAARTNRRGAYRLARRFARGRTVQVRVVVRRQAGWVGGPAISNVMRVRVA